MRGCRKEERWWTRGPHRVPAEISDTISLGSRVVTVGRQPIILQDDSSQMRVIDTTVSVLGQSVAVTTYRQAYEQVETWARAADRAYLVEAANVHTIAMARHDPEFGQVMRAFDVLLPDGMPLVWAINRSLGKPLETRVYGPELMLRCMDWSREAGDLGHYLFGSTGEVLDQLERQLQDHFGGVRIVGKLAPPFREWTEEEDCEFIEQIRLSGANLVWIGLGCPKQERWLRRNKRKLPPGVYFGIGAAFPLNAGVIRQAPGWMQKRGLEWLFRLFIEPLRLWKRYLGYNSLFLYYLMRERMGGDRRSVEEGGEGATPASRSKD